MPRRHELSDAQWDAVRGWIPGKAGDPGQTGRDNRRFFDAVLSAARTGIPWRDRPERSGQGNRVWKRFNRWCERGVWQKLAQILDEPNLEELLLDSTTVKAHQSSTGARRLAGEKRGGRPQTLPGPLTRRPV